MTTGHPDYWYYRDHEDIPIDAEQFDDDDPDAKSCEAPLKTADNMTWECTRSTNHHGRHVACGDSVIAAWPGTHTPCEDDLTAPAPDATGPWLPPYITRHDDGRVTVTWPADRRPVTVDPDVIDAWADTVNELIGTVEIALGLLDNAARRESLLRRQITDPTATPDPIVLSDPLPEDLAVFRERWDRIRHPESTP